MITLQDTFGRTVGFFNSTIEPRLKEGRNVLLVAHGNVLRCIISHLSGLSELEMLRLQVLTALPYAYAYNGSIFVQGCVLPTVDRANTPCQDLPLGITSGLKKGEIDSLI
jgi:broad specificity phosphatase PhoE